MKTATLVLTILAMATGAIHAAEPLKLSINAELIGFPAGSICRIEVAAEYRVVEPQSAMTDRGKMVPVPDSATTFRAEALERHDWDLQTTGATAAKQMRFTIPGDLPKAHPGAHSGIYIPVKYTVMIPGKPERSSRPVFAVRLDKENGGELSRCLKLEIAGGNQLRVALLPTCKHSIDDLNAQPLLQGEDAPSARQQ